MGIDEIITLFQELKNSGVEEIDFSVSFVNTKYPYLRGFIDDISQIEIGDTSNRVKTIMLSSQSNEDYEMDE